MNAKTITTLTLTLLIGGILIAPVAAQPHKPLNCELQMNLFWTTPLHWEGSVTGDVEGTITVTELPPSFPGKTEHFSETFEIATADGLIRGVDKGVWSFVTFKWRAVGQITEATGIWADTIGEKVFEIGGTTPLGAEVAAWGTITIMPN
jgi:hypothetical protein